MAVERARHPRRSPCCEAEARRYLGLALDEHGGEPQMIVTRAPLTDEQLHELGMAAANLEAAVGESPEAFRVGHDHALIIGDALVFAMARKGFVVEHDPARAAVVAAEYERSPEQAPKLS